MTDTKDDAVASLKPRVLLMLSTCVRQMEIAWMMQPRDLPDTSGSLLESFALDALRELRGLAVRPEDAAEMIENATLEELRDARHVAWMAVPDPTRGPRPPDGFCSWHDIGPCRQADIDDRSTWPDGFTFGHPGGSPEYPGGDPESGPPVWRWHRQEIVCDACQDACEDDGPPVDPAHEMTPDELDADELVELRLDLRGLIDEMAVESALGTRARLMLLSPEDLAWLECP